MASLTTHDSARDIETQIGAGAPSPPTLGAYVDDLAAKASNARRCLEGGLVRLVRGVFRAP